MSVANVAGRSLGAYYYSLPTQRSLPPKLLYSQETKLGPNKSKW